MGMMTTWREARRLFKEHAWEVSWSYRTAGQPLSDLSSVCGGKEYFAIQADASARADFWANQIFSMKDAASGGSYCWKKTIFQRMRLVYDIYDRRRGVGFCQMKIKELELERARLSLEQTE